MTAPFHRRPFLQPPMRVRNRISRRVAFTLIVSHLVLLVALGLSLRWNVVRAGEHSLALNRAYARGCIAGVRWAEAIINQALSAETIWENDTPAEPEAVGDDKL